MPTCKECGKQWGWTQTVKRSFTLDPGMKCPHCEKKQYLTAKSKRRSGLFVFIFPLLLPIVILSNLSILTVLGVYIGLFLLILSMYPLLAELSNEEEFLW